MSKALKTKACTSLWTILVYFTPEPLSDYWSDSENIFANSLSILSKSSSCYVFRYFSSSGVNFLFSVPSFSTSISSFYSFVIFGFSFSFSVFYFFASGLYLPSNSSIYSLKLFLFFCWSSYLLMKGSKFFISKGFTSSTSRSTAANIAPSDRMTGCTAAAHQVALTITHSVNKANMSFNFI